MALITGLLIELILGHDKFVVNPASVTAAAAETAALVLEAEAVTLGMFMPSNVISPFMLRGLIFSIQSRSREARRQLMSRAVLDKYYLFLVKQIFSKKIYLR